MAKLEIQKSSDEILNELFNSLNLPLSPKNDDIFFGNLQSDKGSDFEDNSSSSKLSTDLSSSSTTDQEIDKLLEEIADISEKNLELNKSPKIIPNVKKKKKKKDKKDSQKKSKSKRKKERKNSKEKKTGKEKESHKSTRHAKKSKRCKSVTPDKKEKDTCDKAKKESIQSEKYKRKKRYSRSKSRSRSRTRSHSYSKNRKKSYSRSRSKSKSRLSRSRHNSSSRYHSPPHSNSGLWQNGIHKSKRICSSNSGSFSPSPRRNQKEKGKYRSKSRSPTMNEVKDPLDVWRTAKLASLQKNLNEANTDSKLISDEKYSEEDILKSKGIQIENIPLPVSSSNQDSLIPNLSVIPLPTVVSDLVLNKVKEIDLETIPIPSSEERAPSTNETNKASEAGVGIALQKSDLVPKSQEKIRDEGKGKVIVIKSLKDSIVFQQAEEEAQKKAKSGENIHSSPPSTPPEGSKESAAEVLINNEKQDKASLNPILENEAIEALCLSEDKSHSSLMQKETVDKKSPSNAKIIEEGEIVSGEESDLNISEAKKSKEAKENYSKRREGGKDHKKKDHKKSRHQSSSHNQKKRKSRSHSNQRSQSQYKHRRSRSHSKRRSRSRSKHRKSRSRSKKRSRRDRSRSHPRRRSRSNKSVSRSRSKRRSSSHTRNKHNKSESRRCKRSRSRSDESNLKSKTLQRKRRSSSQDRKERSTDCVDSLRDKATRKRLLEVARRNAVYLMKNNCLPPIIEKESVKATGKSVEELTSFCQQLVAKEYSDAELSDPSLSPDEQESQFEKPFAVGRHPFAIKDSKPILMNIRNAPMLPTKTNAERLADTSKLREQFPVSSGSQHRSVAESGWVLVEKDKVKDKEEEIMVFPEPKGSIDVDLSQLVSTRLSAMRRLQDNPADQDAKKALDSAQKEMQDWALSKQKPGQFTGSTGARILSQEELSSGYQAWARKEQFKEANPVSSHFGLKMLQKMGWNPGEGLGKNKEGQLEPLVLDVKMDKKGLTAPEEMTPRRTPIPLAKSLAGKHPVSALVEICSKRKWPPPEFEIVFDCGPDHKKNFLMKVHVNNQIYKPAIAASTKKIAKANAAAACLQALGLITKDLPSKPQGTLHTSSQLHPPLPPVPNTPHSQAGLLGAAPHIQSPPEGQDALLNFPTQSMRVPLNIPTPQPPPPPLPSSAPPPLPEECSTVVPPGEETTFQGQIPHTPTAAPNVPSQSQPLKSVIHTPSIDGVNYGVSSLYVSNSPFEQIQYYGGPFQPHPF